MNKLPTRSFNLLTPRSFSTKSNELHNFRSHFFLNMLACLAFNNNSNARCRSFAEMAMSRMQNFPLLFALILLINWSTYAVVLITFLSFRNFVWSMIVTIHQVKSPTTTESLSGSELLDSTITSASFSISWTSKSSVKDISLDKKSGFLNHLTKSFRLHTCWSISRVFSPRTKKQFSISTSFRTFTILISTHSIHRFVFLSSQQAPPVNHTNNLSSQSQSDLSKHRQWRIWEAERWVRAHPSKI